MANKKLKMLDSFNRTLKELGRLYDYTALSLNASEEAYNAWNLKSNQRGINTTANLPRELKQYNRNDFIYTKEELLCIYGEKLHFELMDNYLIRSIALLDILCEKVYLYLTNEQIYNSQKINDIKLSTWKNDNLGNKLEKDRKDKKISFPGISIFFDYFAIYQQLRVIRHAIIHNSSRVSNRQKKLIHKYRKKMSINTDEDIVLLLLKKKNVQTSHEIFYKCAKYYDDFIELGKFFMTYY